MRYKIILLLFILSLLVTNVFGQEATGESPRKAQKGDDLRAKTQNPVGSLISLPFKFTVDFGASDGSAYFLNVQPVIPIRVGNWNLINRIIAPVIHVEGFIFGTPSIPEGKKGGSSTGLGDINYSLFVSPAEAGKVIWGVGPSISFPTASHGRLGTEKFSAGPTAVVLTQPKPWTLGVLGRQLWSFAGDSDRSSVSQFLLEPFINYNMDKGWYLISDMILTANWHESASNRWTIPLGGGVGKIFKIGNQAMNSRLEFYGNVVRPSGAPNWSMSWTIQFLFSK